MARHFGIDGVANEIITAGTRYDSDVRADIAGGLKKSPPESEDPEGFLWTARLSLLAVGSAIIEDLIDHETHGEANEIALALILPDEACAFQACSMSNWV